MHPLDARRCNISGGCGGAEAVIWCITRITTLGSFWDTAATITVDTMSHDRGVMMGGKEGRKRGRGVDGKRKGERKVSMNTKERRVEQKEKRMSIPF